MLYIKTYLLLCAFYNNEGLSSLMITSPCCSCLKLISQITSSLLRLFVVTFDVLFQTLRRLFVESASTFFSEPQWLLLKSGTAIQRYRNRNLEPEPGTVHNLCKLEHFAPQEIYIIIIYRGVGEQFNDSIKYHMQGILMFKLLTVTKQRMNIVVALHSKTCFVIARPFFLSVLIWLHVTHLVYLAAALDYEMPADREGNHGTQSRLPWIQQQLCAKLSN
jgi:hypothetical protein